MVYAVHMLPSMTFPEAFFEVLRPRHCRFQITNFCSSSNLDLDVSASEVADGEDGSQEEHDDVEDDNKA
ncbi:unnamed protein product [Trifolium pratense]|uniref:Uncharacterized protein n=1 Tax=Trifolium pratense TaxID=57577 RepID=A0ACB0LJ33_TRIPR|nr:unnamed protein product [Trifolium pratense]